MKKNRVATVGITMGDPSGIGPEVILKSFDNPEIRTNSMIVIGDYSVMHAAHKMLGITSFSVKSVDDASKCHFSSSVLNVLDQHLVNMDDLVPGKVQAAAGDAAYRCIVKAVDMVKKGDIDAIATAPINKEALHLAGHDYPGHTEILASLTGTEDYAMLLYDSRLSVIHVSTHIPLLQAVKDLKRERIEKVIGMADVTMRKIRCEAPAIAVAGINPHAGEGGLFGREEKEEIIPAVKNMREKGINVEGPCSPDTVFLQAVKGRYDIVVAMYHDQGHIPLKLVGFRSGVNITAGLPFIRTSVDHGTAFEIAWQGKATETSMVEAIKLAACLTV